MTSQGDDFCGLSPTLPNNCGSPAGFAFGASIVLRPSAEQSHVNNHVTVFRLKAGGANNSALTETRLRLAGIS